MEKSQITDKQCGAVWHAAQIDNGPPGYPEVRAALEQFAAPLHARIAELQAQVNRLTDRGRGIQYGKDRHGWFQVLADGTRHDWDDPEETIADLEAQLAQRAVPTVVGVVGAQKWMDAKNARIAELDKLLRGAEDARDEANRLLDVRDERIAELQAEVDGLNACRARQAAAMGKLGAQVDMLNGGLAESQQHALFQEKVIAELRAQLAQRADSGAEVSDGECQVIREEVGDLEEGYLTHDEVRAVVKAFLDARRGALAPERPAFALTAREKDALHRSRKFNQWDGDQGILLSIVDRALAAAGSE